MTTPLIYLAVAALVVAAYLAGRSAQIRTNAQTDARMRGEIARLGKVIAESIKTNEAPT